MTYFKWAIRLVLALLVLGFLHYTLPQHDIVRITNTYEKRIDFGSNSWFWANGDSGNATAPVNRDVFFIETFQTNEKPMIYRNEDTGWGWPPYFKFNTANLQARASDLIGAKDDGATQWAVIRHYGWRNEFLSIYPNATSVRPATGPDERIIPWFNGVLLILLAGAFWALWVRWVRFRSARIDPALEPWLDRFTNIWDWLATKLWRRTP
jgi:hypothetical protein